MQEKNGVHLDRKERFTQIYKTNGFKGKESKSGRGSDFDQTIIIKKEIPLLLKSLGVKTFIDAPCGDFNWQKDMVLKGVKYIGIDIVSELIDDITKDYIRENLLNYINQLEPRVIIDTLSVWTYPEERTIVINIKFYLKANSDVIESLDVVLRN